MCQENKGGNVKSVIKWGKGRVLSQRFFLSHSISSSHSSASLYGSSKNNLRDEFLAQTART